MVQKNWYKEITKEWYKKVQTNKKELLLFCISSTCKGTNKYKNIKRLCAAH